MKAMRLNRLGTLGLMALMLLTACDGVVSYTVVNETDEELLTWVMYDDCQSLTTFKQDYGPIERSLPNSRLNYTDVFGTLVTPDERCIQVATTDRRLVLAKDYSEDKTFTIMEPVSTVSDSLPPIESLPGKPWREELADTWMSYLPLAAFILVGMLGGTVALFLYRRSRAATGSAP